MRFSILCLFCGISLIAAQSIKTNDDGVFINGRKVLSGPGHVVDLTDDGIYVGGKKIAESDGSPPRGNTRPRTPPQSWGRLEPGRSTPGKVTIDGKPYRAPQRSGRRSGRRTRPGRRNISFDNSGRGGSVTSSGGNRGAMGMGGSASSGGGGNYAGMGVGDDGSS